MTETRTRNDPTDTPFAPTRETGEDRVPPNSHEVTRVPVDTNQDLVLTKDNASFGKNDISTDFLAITRFSQENRTKRDSQDPIPNILKVDITPKETSSILGPADMGGVISKMIATHCGLFSVPISYMQPTIDPIGLDGMMHDKGTMQPCTQKVSHAKDIKKGTLKKFLRPMTNFMHTNDLNHDKVGVKRGRLETESSIEVVSTKEPRRCPSSEGHDSDKIASTVKASGQPC